MENFGYISKVFAKKDFETANMILWRKPKFHLLLPLFLSNFYSVSQYEDQETNFIISTNSDKCPQSHTENTTTAPKDRSLSDTFSDKILPTTIHMIYISSSTSKASDLSFDYPTQNHNRAIVWKIKARKLKTRKGWGSMTNFTMEKKNDSRKLFPRRPIGIYDIHVLPGWIWDPLEMGTDPVAYICIASTCLWSKSLNFWIWSFTINLK